MPEFKIGKPQSRGERHAQRAFRVHAYHTHNVASSRKPGQYVDVRCTRADCYRITRPDGTVRFGSAREYGR